MKWDFLYNKWFFPVLLVAYACISSYIAATKGGDFDVYLDAAEKLQRGENIYAPPFIKGLQYFYSVFFALVLIPFTSQYFIAELIWLLLSYFLLYRILILIQNYFDLSLLTTKQSRLWVFLIILLSTQFILYNVSMIQVTIFLLWCVFESFNFINKEKYIYAGLLLGLAINIKILPVLILPYLFYRGYFKALTVSILTFIGLLYLPALFIGADHNQFLLSEWWGAINPSNKEHLFEAGIGTHSIVALLPVYLTETVGEMEYKRNILDLSHAHVELIINITRLFILSLSLFYFRAMPFKKENNLLKTFWEISFFSMIIPLLMPHQQKYAFLFVLPMISYLLYFFITTYSFKKTSGYKIAFYSFILSMLFFSPLYGSGIIGKFLFLFTQHYRFLTFAALIIIPISIYCNPERMIRMRSEKKTILNS